MSRDDRGYVHDPATERATGEDRDPDDAAGETTHPAQADREFGWRGWILVGVLLFAFIVAPVTIYLIPPGGDGYLFALIILPLFPAVLLAVTAVWATTRP